MNPAPVGTRIRPVRNSNSHNYRIGAVYTINLIRGIRFRAVDAAGAQGNWLAWEDCELVSVHGWDYCRKVLDPDAIDFLSAFDGIERLTLRPDIKDRILLERPGLHDAILGAARSLRERATATASPPESS